MKFDVCGLFRKFWRKFKFGEDLSLILGTLLKDMYIYECSIDAVQKKNHGVYDNVEKYSSAGGPHITI